MTGRQVKRWYDGESPITLQLEIAMMGYDLLAVKAQYEREQALLPKVKRENPGMAQVMEFGGQQLLQHIDRLEKRIVMAMQRTGTEPFWIPTDGKD